MGVYAGWQHYGQMGYYNATIGTFSAVFNAGCDISPFEENLSFFMLMTFCHWLFAKSNNSTIVKINNLLQKVQQNELCCSLFWFCSKPCSKCRFRCGLLCSNFCTLCPKINYANLTSANIMGFCWLILIIFSPFQSEMINARIRNKINHLTLISLLRYSIKCKQVQFYENLHDSTYFLVKRKMSFWCFLLVWLIMIFSLSLFVSWLHLPAI